LNTVLKRKAQISQVFTYLIIILVVGLILIFGYKAVIWITDTHCEQQRISFEKSLLGFIDEYSDYHSIHEETLKAPCDVTEVCFANSSYCPRISSTLSIQGLPDDTVIRSNVDDCTANIFIKNDFTKALAFSDKVVLKGNHYQCFKARNKDFKFLFTGLGRKTMIESGWLN